MKKQDTMLPEPSVLQKLKAHDENAPRIIMDKAQTLAEERRMAEKQTLSASFRKTAWQRVLSAPFMIAGVFRQDPDSGMPDHTGFTSIGTTVGNDIRQAIRLYMAEHDLTDHGMQLDEKERNSLIFQPSAPIRTVKAQKTGFFRKTFPKL